MICKAWKLSSAGFEKSANPHTTWPSRIYLKGGRVKSNTRYNNVKG